MAKSNKFLKMEHVDSLVIWEGSEEEWEQMQPRLKAKYKKVGEMPAAPTPPEARQETSN